MTKILDEILAAIYLAGTENGLGRKITDTDEIMHRKEAFIKTNPANVEAKQLILQWIADEVIGDDESQIRPDGNKNTQEWTNGRNNQRQQQRNKLRALGWKG